MKLVTVILVFLLTVPGLEAQTQPPLAVSHDTTLLQAEQFTLANHPLLHIQSAQVEISRGKLDEASGAFDTVLQGGLDQGRTVTPLTIGELEQNRLAGVLSDVQTEYLTAFQASLTKQLRDGVKLTPNFELTRDTDNLFNTTGVNTTVLNLVVTIPLLRGRGRGVTTADEESARNEVDATSLDLSQLMSQLILNTANSYWALVSAQQNLAISLDTETRGKAYLDHTQELVKADRVPANDLNEAAANLAERVNNRISAEQQCITARQQLASDMGLNSAAMLSQAPQAVDEFPDAAGVPLPSNDEAALAYYLDRALLQRADYLAAKRREKESGIQVAAAANRLQPQLDLSFQGGYAGLREGRTAGNFIDSTVQNVQGPSVGGSINYTFYGGNHASRGAFRESNSVLRQSQFQTQQVARNISQQIAVTVDAVRNASLRLTQARDAVSRFQSSLDGERDKYRAGIGSLLDILNVEDRLTRVLSDQVQAQFDYAVALVQFRFATGTLVPPAGAVIQVPANTFLTLPFSSQPGSRPN